MEEVDGSIPSRSTGVVAQLGERFVRNEEVESSILSDSTEGPVVQLGERQVCNLDVAGSIPAWSTAVAPVALR